MFYLKDHLEKLPAFNSIAKTKSISHAALQLHMSQAALSHSMKVLEEAVGVLLFHRHAKGVVLTEAGRELFEYSKNLIPQLESLEARLKDSNDAIRGHLKIGTHETASIHFLPSLLERFLKKYPGVQISITSSRIDPLIEGLRNHDYHLIFTVEPIGQKDLEISVLFENRLAFFAAPQTYPHRFECLKKNAISLDEVNSVPILTDAQAHQEQYLPIPRMLIMNGIVAQQSFELNSFEAATQLAAKGMGLALLPERNAAAAVKAKQLREIKVHGLPKKFGRYRLCVSRHKEGTMGEVCKALIDEAYAEQALTLI